MVSYEVLQQELKNPRVRGWCTQHRGQPSRWLPYSSIHSSCGQNHWFSSASGNSTSEFCIGAAIEFGVAKWMVQFLSRIFVFARHCFSFTSNWRLPVGPCADKKVKDSNYFTSSDPTYSIIFGHFISHVLGYVIYLTHSDILSDILSHICSDIGILSGILSDIMKTHNFRVK